MKKNTSTLKESLGSMRYMMNYDSSKTRLENEEDSFLTIVTEQNTACPNSIDFNEMLKQVKLIADRVKKMNTAFMRMGFSQQRAKYIYEAIKYLNGKNVYDQEFNECTPAIEKANEIWSSEYRDWFSKGESMVEELQQLANGKYYKGDYAALRYLNGAIKLLQNPANPNEPQVQTAASQQSQDYYKPAAGTPEDPFIPGTMGDAVGKVQQYLGNVKVDNMFGPKTQAALAEKVPQFKDKFTNNDLITIYKTLYPQPGATKIDTSNLKPNLEIPRPSQELARTQANQGATNMAYGFSPRNPAKGV